MVKFLYSTDWHYKGKNPRTRMDDFTSTMEAKIKHFFWLGHELGVDAFLHGGDYFDTKETTSSVVNRLGEIIRDGLKDKMMYGVWGNHDEHGMNPNTVTQTPIGVFQNFYPNFIILNKEPLMFEANGERIKLSGVSSYAKLDTHTINPDTEEIIEHRSRDYVIEESDGTPHIHIVHGWLSARPISDEMRINHTVIDEMRHTKATVTLTGHEHTGFPVTKTNHGLVYNPGALGRVHSSHVEMNRMPKYALITIHKDGKPEIEPIQCPVAKLGTEVMDRKLLDAQQERLAKLKEAKGDIKVLLKELNIKGIDLPAILEQLRETTKPDVFDEVKRRLGY
jgi:DNA repair exonuclease SbcCD nuclease subunit